MHIIRLKLTNFQRHGDLELNLSPQVNIITGSTDVGKSSILRGIRWALFPSELRRTNIRKEGTKKTTVQIELSSGAIIRRIKSASINAYQLEIKGEIKEYNAVGSTLPEEIQKVLNITPIDVGDQSLILNISKQDSTFLIGDDTPGSFRAKLFNELTGNSKLDTVFQELNKDILHVGKDEKTENERIVDIHKSLDAVTQEKEKLNNIIVPFEQELIKLKETNKQYEYLSELFTKFIENRNKLNEVKKTIGSIKLIPEKTIKELKTMVETYHNHSKLLQQFVGNKEKLIEIKHKLNLIKSINPTIVDSLKLSIDRLIIIKKLWANYQINKDNLEKNRLKLEKIKIPKIDIKELNNQINKLIVIKQLQIKYNKNIEANQITKINLEKKIEELNKNIGAYKDKLRLLGVCPTCKSKISEEILERIK